MTAPALDTYDPRTFRALTFYDATPRFRDGTDTPRAYLERCLETITAREPMVQAFVVLNEADARTTADASTARWQEGRPLSAIDGLPIGIKDLLETRDMPTQMGCEAYRGHFPKRDNAAVWALRQAGAVILGKTVTAELGGSHPGPTRNPFDPERTPGGSSSGSAAAVAAHMVPAAIGTQVGGSIIRPAGLLRQRGTEADPGRHQPWRTPGHEYEHAWRACWLHRGHVAGRDRDRASRRGRPWLPRPVRSPDTSRRRAARTPDRAGDGGLGGLDDTSKAGFEKLLESLQRAGVTLLRRTCASVDRGVGAGHQQRGRHLQRHHRLGKPLGAAQPGGPVPRRRQRTRQEHAGPGRGDEP